MIIGLTGAYCAGKNHIAAILEKHGLPVLDVDKLGYKVIETEKQKIASRFGEDILRPDGTVDRKLLGSKVFGKPGELADLEAIIHPAVNLETAAWIEAQQRPCVINAALLHKSSAFSMLNALIVVEAPVLTRLIRAKKRDKLSLKDIFRRFTSQKGFSSQYFQKRTDIYRVKNRGYSGFISFLGVRFIKRPEDRINEILSDLGLS
ncbi:MAG: dephospho-CoA kinase [Treponema sp.]|nr:dephospho-CoA kinase [Treponema sp.]